MSFLSLCLFLYEHKHVENLILVQKIYKFIKKCKHLRKTDINKFNKNLSCLKIVEATFWNERLHSVWFTTRLHNILIPIVPKNKITIPLSIQKFVNFLQYSVFDEIWPADFTLVLYFPSTTRCFSTAL